MFITVFASLIREGVNSSTKMQWCGRRILTTSSSLDTSCECQQSANGHLDRRTATAIVIVVVVVAYPPAALTRNSFNWTLTRSTMPKTHETNFYREHAGIECVTLVDSTGIIQMRERERGGGGKGKEKGRRGKGNRNAERENLAGTGALISFAAFLPK